MTGFCRSGSVKLVTGLFLMRSFWRLEQERSSKKYCSVILVYFSIAGMVDFVFWRRRPSGSILKEMLNDLEDHRRGRRHIYGLSNDLNPFTQTFPDLHGATIASISNYLRTLSVGPRRRDNILASIVQLSRFARSRGYLPEDRKSPAEKIKHIKAPRDDVEIWTVPETRLLLDHVSKKWAPFMAIGLFAGLRTSEILRLDWSAFHWDYLNGEGKAAPFIAVKRKIAKTRTDRIVSIQENLLAWLEPYRHHRVGPLYPGGDCKSNENARSREMLRIRRATGLPRKDNALRHSYGSYRLAVAKDYSKVSLEMGNSPEKLREHYNCPRPEAEGLDFFRIRPASLENVIPLHLPLEFRV
jgi:integrase